MGPLQTVSSTSSCSVDNGPWLAGGVGGGGTASAIIMLTRELENCWHNEPGDDSDDRDAPLFASYTSEAG